MILIFLKIKPVLIRVRRFIKMEEKRRIGKEDERLRLEREIQIIWFSINQVQGNVFVVS